MSIQARFLEKSNHSRSHALSARDSLIRIQIAGDSA